MTAIADRQRPAADQRLDRLRRLCTSALARMYRPECRRFVFRLQRGADSGIQAEGLSGRYTAIVLLALAQMDEAEQSEVLRGDRPVDVCRSLLQDATRVGDAGQVALTLWAAAVHDVDCPPDALDALVRALGDPSRAETVCASWALSALCQQRDGPGRELRDALADLLIRSFAPRSGLFPHRLTPRGIGRAHVSCFADLVYPIQALAFYAAASGRGEALEAASACAERVCGLMGRDGQWWWHYDVRTGRVIEGYPVYAVHQDGMAPMALFALHEAGGPDHRDAIRRGVAWLESAPELGGGTLIDEAAGLIWRKVARREPRKLVRRVQALASALGPRLRVPGVEWAFPPGAVDYECRPYHLGWLLYAWTPRRRHAWWSAGAGG